MNVGRGYLVTALLMLVLGLVGLLTAREITPSTLNVIFFLAFFPAILGGAIALLGCRKGPEETRETRAARRGNLARRSRKEEGR